MTSCSGLRVNIFVLVFLLLTLTSYINVRILSELYAQESELSLQQFRPVPSWRSYTDTEEIKNVEDDSRTIKDLVAKSLHNIKNDKAEFPPNTLGAFIHVGKTGGSSLCEMLRNACHASVAKPCPNKDHAWLDMNEGILSKISTYYHVPDIRNGNLYKQDRQMSYSFFVVTIRDPLQRAMSSFLYEHPSNKAMEGLYTIKRDKPRKYKNIMSMSGNDESEAAKTIYRRKKKRLFDQELLDMYVPCFPTLERYAQLLGNFHEDVHTWKNWRAYKDDGDCENLAKSTFRHGGAAMIHNHYDLRKILMEIKDLGKRPILAIRTEGLYDDWKSVNNWLGEENSTPTLILSLRNSTNIDYPVKKIISDDGKKKLCFALRDEYRLYLRVLVLSKNLSEKEVQQSYNIARKSCPWLNLQLPQKDTPQVFYNEGDGRKWRL